MLFKVSVYPVGQNEAVDLLKKSGLPCTLSTVGSVVEGEWVEVVEVLGEIYRRIRDEYGRVYMTIGALDQPESTFGTAPTPFGHGRESITGGNDRSVRSGVA